MKHILGGLIALAILLPQTAWADRAQLLMLPTRIVLEKRDRYVTVMIKNVGDATGNISAEMIDMVMGEDGHVGQIEEGKDAPYSAIPYLRISPHSMTLKPGDVQNVRLMLRKPEKLPTGEYRSHLKVRMEDDNVEGSTAAALAQKGTGIAVKANLALTIPVIVRNGDTTVSVKIESPRVTRDDKGNPSVELFLQREGDRSVMGDFSFSYHAPDGTTRELKPFPGIAIYRPLARRIVTIPLIDLPAGVNLKAGKLDIAYAAQKQEGGMKLATAAIELSGR